MPSKIAVHSLWDVVMVCIRVEGSSVQNSGRVSYDVHTYVVSCTRTYPCETPAASVFKGLV